MSHQAFLLNWISQKKYKHSGIYFILYLDKWCTENTFLQLRDAPAVKVYPRNMKAKASCWPTSLPQLSSICIQPLRLVGNEIFFITKTRQQSPPVVGYSYYSFGNKSTYLYNCTVLGVWIVGRNLHARIQPICSGSPWLCTAHNNS